MPLFHPGQIDLIGTALDPRAEAGGEMLLVLNLMLRLWGAVARDRRDLVLENIARRHQVAC